MDLKALLATDPDASAEYDRTLAAHGTAEFDKGKAAGKAEVVAESERVFSFMKADSAYAQNPQIQKACIGVLQGDRTLSGLEDLVSMHDMMEEKKKSEEGKKESKENGDTPGDPDASSTTDGKVKDKESLDAAVTSIKNFI